MFQIYYSFLVVKWEDLTLTGFDKIKVTTLTLSEIHSKNDSETLKSLTKSSPEIWIGGNVLFSTFSEVRTRHAKKIVALNRQKNQRQENSQQRRSLRRVNCRKKRQLTQTKGSRKS